MKKYSKKKVLKENGFLSSLFGYFSHVFSVFDDIEPFKTFKKKNTFKSVILAFKGKSPKQIKQHFEMEKIKKEEEMRKRARKELGM